jgi:hypothetical protein
MSHDPFEALAQQAVPPPPPQFDRLVHQRVNRALVVLQLLEMVVRILPYAAYHFLRAGLGAIALTLFGPPKPKR